MATMDSASQEEMVRRLLAAQMSSLSNQQLLSTLWQQQGIANTLTGLGTSADPQATKIARLEQEVRALRAERDRAYAGFAQVTAELAIVRNARPLLTDAALKQLITLAHPDKWPNNPLAHEITVVLNKLREQLKG